MIKKLEIINFRNIKHLTLDLDRVAIITGQNNLGKSNSLNALNWLVTNKLLTDKYGEGESDIMSIIPIDHRKGEHTEVSIWLDSGTKFTKVYKRSYDKYTNKVIKHETEYLINDAKCGTQQEFYNSLYIAFGFNPKFTSLKVEEQRLFTDPLYALLKLDYKELRKLLVALGCSVSNEELYNLGFRDLEPYETQYMGKWDVMRKNLKDNIKNLNIDITTLENQLALYNDVVEPDSSKLTDLQNQKTALITELNEVKTKNTRSMVEDIENQITKLNNNLDLKRNSLKLEYQSKINALMQDKVNISTNIEKTKFDTLKCFIEPINDLRNELIMKKSNLADLNLGIGKHQNNLSTYNYKSKSLEMEKNNLSDRLGKAINEKDELICPVCGSPIQLNKEAHEQEIAELTDRLNQIDVDLEQLDQQKEDTLQLIENLQVEKKTLEESISADSLRLSAKELAKANAEKELCEKFSQDNQEKEIQDQILELEEKVRNINDEFKPELAEIDSLLEKKNTIILDSQKAVNEQVEIINQKITALDEEIKNEYILKNNYELKCEKEKSIQDFISKLNDEESLLERLNAFIHRMCQLINDKAKEITGFNFVMLEENLTNDGITETCYCVDDNNVPYKDINTARKVEMGIKFIDVVRKQNPNNLPIMVDRLEGIDHIEKISKFTDKQLICTRVSTDTNLNVINTI